MPDFSKILFRIADLKKKLLKDSISPYYLGSILEEMLGYSWWSDTPGNFSLRSLKVDTLEAASLVVDRILSLDTDTILTESDIIEDVTDNADGTFTLRLQRRWEGYVTAQIEHNILRGFSQLTTQNSDLTTYNSWMNVVSVDGQANEITVSLYPDNETPARRNYPPVPGMKFARWGNSGDSSDPRYARRQSCVWLSSSEGVIRKYYKVTKPILYSGNYAASFGTLPDFLWGIDERIHTGDDGIYADTVVARRFLLIDSLGKPVVSVIDRGPWSPGETYYDGSAPNDNGVYERSLVWHNGHGWLCNTGGVADLSNAPKWNTTYWTHSVGDTMLRLEFNEVDTIVDIDYPECRLSVTATYMGEDVTDSPAIYYDWTRLSKRDGVVDTVSDDLWAQSHLNYGPGATLTESDMNFQFGAAPERLEFTVTATLHDPSNPNLRPQSAQFYML